MLQGHAERSDQKMILVTPNNSLAVTGRPCVLLPNFDNNELQLTHQYLLQKRKFHIFVHDVINSLRARSINRILQQEYFLDALELQNNRSLLEESLGKAI